MNPNKLSFINPKKWPFFYGYLVLIFVNNIKKKKQ
jgi:hypothetical protein